MLVLSRKAREEIIITYGNEKLLITVQSISPDGKRVRLGFIGSKSFNIMRDDVKTMPEHAFITQTIDCPICYGSKQVIDANCKNCSGTGKIAC